MEIRERLDRIGEKMTKTGNEAGSAEVTGYVCPCGKHLDNKIILGVVAQIAEEWRAASLTEGGRFQDFLFNKLNT